MRSLFTTVFCLVLLLSAHAQKDNNKTKDSKEKTGNSEVSATDDAVTTLTLVLTEKQREIGRLNDSIATLHKERKAADQHWADSAKLLNSRLADADRRWADSIKARQKTIAQLQNENSQLHERIEAAGRKDAAAGKISEVVFRQCLLYPLERRYDSTLIKESLESLEAIGIADKPAYRKYANAYIHLLKDYGRYNRQLIDIMNDAFKSFSFKRWQINSMVAQGVLDQLKAWEYYKYYVRRNQDPWESIIYLDEIIEELVNMLHAPETITEDKCNKLLNKTTPKQP